MADPKVLLKRSSVAGRAPSIGDLDYGELAINFADGKLYYKDNSNTIKAFIDSARVEAIANSIPAGTDSDAVIAIIDSAYVQSRVPLSYLEGLIDSAYIQARQNLVDSASVSAIIVEDVDSAYVQARQDYSYNSLTDVPTPDLFDSNDAVLLIDSAYVRARVRTDQDLYRTSDVTFANTVITGNLTVDGTTTTINSTTLSVNDKNIILADSAADSAAANGAGITVDGANAKITYNSITDRWEFNKDIDGDVVGNLTGNVTGTVSDLSNHTTTDLAEGDNLYYTTARHDSDTLAQVDAAYVQARQITYNTSDFTDSAFVTGLPVSTFTNDANYLDSNTVTDVIDQTYVRDNQITYNTSNFTDSAFVTGLPVSTFTNDANYLDSNTVTDVIDQTYVRDNQITYTTLNFTDSAFVTGLPVSTFTNDANYLDSTTAQTLIDVSYIRNLTDSDYIKTVQYLDNEQLKFGNAEGLRIYNDGTRSYIIDSAVGSFLDIQGRSISLNNELGFAMVQTAETFARMMYRDPGDTSTSNQLATKLITTGYGIDVTGGITADSIAIDRLILSNETVDSAWVQARQITYNTATFLDSTTVQGVIDQTYIRNNQIKYNTSDFADSAFVTGLPVSTFTNDANYLDSTTATSLIDSAYVQARQDYAYSSLTGTPTIPTFGNDFVDSATVIDIINSEGLDSDLVIALVDSAYIQLRDRFQDSSLVTSTVNDAYIQARQIKYNTSDFTDSAFVTGLPVSTFTNDANYLDSTTVTGVIDQAYVRNNQIKYNTNDFTDSAFVTGLPVSTFTNDANYLDSTTVEGIIDSAYVQARQVSVENLLDEAGVTALVDSAYVQARQISYNTSDFTDSAFVTGLPVSTFTNDANYLDSNTVTGVIDQTYVRDNQIQYNTSNFTDSAFVTGLPVSTFTNDANYLDSTTVQGVIDTTYVNNLIAATYLDSAEAIQLIDSAHVQLRQDYAYSSLTGLPDFFDSADAETLVDSAYVQARQIKYNTSDFVDSAFVTGLPVSTFTNDVQYLDSTTVTGVIDQTYVRDNQIKYNTSDFTDSAFVTGLPVSTFTNDANYLDSTTGRNILSGGTGVTYDNATGEISIDSGSTVTVTQITTNIGITDHIDFTGVSPAHAEGRIFYDSANGALAVYNDETDITLLVGQEEYIRVYNNTDSTITSGKAVYLSGEFNEVPTAALADASNASAYEVVGLATHDIEASTYGYVTTRGLVTDINTSNLTSGQRVHLGFASPGSLTQNAPDYPNFPMDIGLALIIDSAAGKIYVDIQSHTFEKFRATGNSRVDGDFTVAGNLNILGTETITSVTNLQVADNFIYLGAGDVITTQFTGTGLNDGLFKSYYTGDSNVSYYVRIKAVDSLGDTIEWAFDSDFSTILGFDSANGPTEHDLGVDRTLISLRDHIKITFEAASGHTVGDRWFGDAAPTNQDLGFVGNYNTPNDPYAHAGLFRDTTDERFKFFHDYTPEVEGNINTADSSFAYAPVQFSTGYGDIVGDVTGTVTDISNHSTSDLSEGTNQYYTTARANAAIDARVDSAYVQARQTSYNTSDFTDSAFVTGLPVSTFTNDANYLDSTTVTGVIDATYVNNLVSGDYLDSAEAIALIDTAHVQARQIKYNTSDFTDSAFVTGLPVSTFTNDVQYLDSTTVQGVIDQTYVRDNQIKYNTSDFTDSSFVTGLPVSTFTNDVQYLDSTTVTGVIDAAYVQTNQIDYLDSALTTQLIDSAYVQARQVSVESLLDEAGVIALVDSAYVQARQVDLQRDSGFIKTVDYNDDEKLHFGTDQDVEIFHDGTDLFIKNNTSANTDTIITGDRVLLRNKANTETMGSFNANGVVSLSNDNSIKFQTQGYGVRVYGSVVADSATLTNLTLNGQSLDSSWVQSRTLAGLDSAAVSDIITADVDKAFVDALNVDADTLDNQNGTYYLDYDNFTNTPTIPSLGNDFVDSAEVVKIIINETLDSDLIVQLVDSAYIQLRDRFQDSSLVTSTVNDAYVQARQIKYNTSDFTDSAFVTGLPVSTFTNDVKYLDSSTVTGVINASYIQSNQTTYTNVSEFTNDANYLDSNTVQGVIDATYVQTNQITYNTSNFTDSAFVTGLPVSTFTNDVQYLDSNTISPVFNTLFAAKSTTDLAEGNNLYYTKARADSDIAASLGDSANTVTITVTNVIEDKVDSAYVLNRIAEAPFLDSADALLLIDSDYIKTVQYLDNEKIELGTDADAEIYHDGTDLFIQNNTAVNTDTVITGDRVVLANKGYTQTMASFNAGSVVSLLANNSIKFQTQNTGIRVYGSVVADSATLTNLTLNGQSVDSAWVQARSAASGTDSATVSAIITADVDKAFVDALGINATQLNSQNASYYLDYDNFTNTPTIPTFGNDFVDSATVIDIINSEGLDSDLVVALVDSAYIQLRDRFQDSSLVTTTVDAAYVQARQITYNTSDFTDSAYVTGLNVSTFTNDANYLDSTTATQLIDSSYIETRRPAETIFSVAGNGAVYTFTGDGFSSAANNPTLYLTRGKTYKFANISGSHPFEIRVSDGGAAYSDGVTNNGGSGTVLFTVNMDAPNNLVYQCTIHSGMVGDIVIVDDALILDSARVSSIITADVDAAFINALTIDADTLGGENSAYHLNYDNFTNTPTIPTFGGDFVDSAFVTGLPVSTFTNDVQYLDSTTVQGVIDAAYIQANQTNYLDSALVSQLVDSAYVQLRQAEGESTDPIFKTISVATQDDVVADTTTDTLTLAAGTGMTITTDAASDTITFTSSAGTDSAATIALIQSTVDSAYVQARDAIAREPMKVTTFIYTADSGDTTFTGADDNGAILTYHDNRIQVFLNGILLLDSDDYTANNGTSVVTSALDSGDVLVISEMTGQVGLDSAGIIQLIDSAYVQLRENNADAGLDSSLITQLIDSAYVQLRQTSGGGSVDSASTIAIVQEELAVTTIGDILGTDGNPGDVLVSDGDGTASWSGYGASSFEFKVTYDGSGLVDSVQSLPTGWTVDSQGTSLITIGHNTGRSVKDISYNAYVGGNLKLYPKDSADALYSSVANRLNEFTAKVDNTTTGADASQYAWINIIF